MRYDFPPNQAYEIPPNSKYNTIWEKDHLMKMHNSGSANLY